MGWGVPWRVALPDKAVAVTFNMWVISKDGNKEDFNSLPVISTQLEVSGEVILSYLSPSRSKVTTKTPMRNPIGIKVSTSLD